MVELLRFIGNFLVCDPKSLIIEEYDEIRKEIEEGVVGRPSALEHFSFLAQHLAYRLKTLSFPSFL